MTAITIQETDEDRLRRLRSFEAGAYTNDELQFIYRMHKQDEYRYENFQIPERVENCKENKDGEQPGQWCKWTHSRLDS